MKFIAWFWIIMWFCAFLTIGLASGCAPVVAVPVAKADPACPAGLSHDDCVMAKFFTKYPGMLPRK